ncbi:hypothetical protein Mgra_00006077, partial [Meloidogyne graminicola]
RNSESLSLFIQNFYLIIFIFFSGEKTELKLKNKLNSSQQLLKDFIPTTIEKRRLFSLYSILNNKRSDSNFIGGFEALPVNTRSLEGIRNNCYFSPIQCYYMDERKRRSVK